ncbi:hypothetical protein C3941_15735 [Kaistia algarum]|uniref:hypothetical protein n=1 Tax=Kaistia algarum TaxID=2083279 RepID=UPI000CE86B11|nr:hypothetical protein [Kaistia algarum]MCX5514732.1 hypothetical protein [Kaistia algarum]PPE78846.1 hypothetical protein C3941_15735 [Kaistia algarum]
MTYPANASPQAVAEILERYRMGAINFAEQRDQLQKLGAHDPALRSFVETFLRWTQVPGNNEVEWLAQPRPHRNYQRAPSSDRGALGSYEASTSVEIRSHRTSPTAPPRTWPT